MVEWLPSTDRGDELYPLLLPSVTSSIVCTPGGVRSAWICTLDFVSVRLIDGDSFERL